MEDTNKFRVSGNVTADLVLRATGNGTPTTTYTVASKDDKGHTSYIPITTYGKQAENDAKYLKKGSAVTAEGSIHSWSKPAEKKYGFNFVAHTVHYGKRTAPSANRPASTAATPAEAGNPPAENGDSAPAANDPSGQSSGDWMADYVRAEAEMQRQRRA